MHKTITSNQLSKRLLVILVALSWVLYPFSSIYFLARTTIQLAFLGLFLSVTLLLFIMMSPRIPVLSNLQNIILILWAAFLFFLLFASLQSSDPSALGYFFNFLLKYLFFFVLLIYLNFDIIHKIFSIYSHLMLYCVILAVAVAIGVAFDFFHPVYMLQTTGAGDTFLNYKYYFGAVYGYSIVPAPFILYRLQSFVGEPGAFAMALAPAFYYFWFVEKNKINLAIILIGLIGTFSAGIALCFLLLAVAFAFQSKRYLNRFFLTSPPAILAFILLLATSWGGNYVYWKFSTENRHSSLSARILEIQKTSEYLQTHILGSGAGVGMKTVHYAISNGYVKAFLESGYLGGITYLVLFFLMGFLAYKRIKPWLREKSPKNNLGLVVGLSVITVLFMGMQREQPDISFWHMWLYASLFVVSSRKYWRVDNAPR